MGLNETHELGLVSWLDSANSSTTDFPIQNLPIAEFRVKDSGQDYRGGIAIGDQIVDLKALAEKQVFSGLVQECLVLCSQAELNDFMAMGQEAWSALRLAMSRALREGADLQATIEDCLVAQTAAEFKLPCVIGDYTDFYTSIYHATAVGSLFRPDNPLLPNYKWVPIGYHGRSSSMDVSGPRVSPSMWSN